MIDDLLPVVPLEYRLELLQGFPPVSPGLVQISQYFWISNHGHYCMLQNLCLEFSVIPAFQWRSGHFTWTPYRVSICDDSLNCEWNIILRKWASWMRVQLQFANKGLKGELWSIQKSTRIYVLTRLSSRAMPATANVTPGFYLLEWGVASECPSTTAQAALSDQQWGRKATHRYRWAPNWPRQST